MELEDDDRNTMPRDFIAFLVIVGVTIVLALGVVIAAVIYAVAAPKIDNSDLSYSCFRVRGQLCLNNSRTKRTQRKTDDHAMRHALD